MTENKLELNLVEVSALILLVNQLASSGLRLTGYEIALLEKMKAWTISNNKDK